MARARNIKPGFFANEELVELPFSTRLLFIGLWTIADRAGRLEDRPKRIKMAIFPADSVDIDAALNELQASGFLLRYEHGGERYIQILAFDKHQNPHKDEKKSTIPAPCGHGASTVQEPEKHDSNPADSLIPDSPNPSSPKEDIPPVPVEPPAAKSSPRKRKTPETPLPADFCISDRVRAWAKEKGYGQLDAHFENFVSACKAKGYTYADWDEGFMGAIRKDWAKLRQIGGFQQGAPPPDVKPILSVDEQVPSLAGPKGKKPEGLDLRALVRRVPA